MSLMAGYHLLCHSKEYLVLVQEVAFFFSWAFYANIVICGEIWRLYIYVCGQIYWVRSENPACEIYSHTYFLCVIPMSVIVQLNAEKDALFKLPLMNSLLCEQFQLSIANMGF